MNNNTFEPMAYLNENEGKNMNLLDFRMLYFRSINLDGSIAHSIKTLNSTMAIVEAKVYLNKSDVPENYVACAIGHAKGNENADYLKEAMDSAVAEALSLAGFDEKYCRAGLIIEKSIAESESNSVIEQEAPVFSTSSVETEVISEPEQTQEVTNIIPPIAYDSEKEELPSKAEQAVKGSALQETERPTYDMNTPVEEIVAVMSLEEAKKVPIMHQRQESTMGQLAIMKPDNISWYAERYSGPNNIFRAAAIVLINAALEKAS